MTKEWMEFDKDAYYPNLRDRYKDESLVDLMLHDGTIVNMCVLRSDKFMCVYRFGNDIYFHKIAKIRLTHNLILRYKNHHWSRFNYCLRCRKDKTNPIPDECDIIYPAYYREAYPDYPKNKRIIPTFEKNEKGYILPIL